MLRCGGRISDKMEKSAAMHVGRGTSMSHLDGSALRTEHQAPEKTRHSRSVF